MSNNHIFYQTKQLEKIKAFFLKGFNQNTGYSIEPIVYPYRERLRIGYCVRKGHIIFGIPGYTRIACFTEKREAGEFIKKNSTGLR